MRFRCGHGAESRCARGLLDAQHSRAASADNYFRYESAPVVDGALTPVPAQVPRWGRLGSTLPATTVLDRFYSSAALSFASTLKSSSVVVSPVTLLPLAISFSKRRMILPLRVFGSASAKRTSSGFAIAPICSPT